MQVCDDVLTLEKILAGAMRFEPRAMSAPDWVTALHESQTIVFAAEEKSLILKLRNSTDMDWQSIPVGLM